MMKIVSGLGSADEYEALVQAGADELFCGYVPAAWQRKYGNLNSLNRREVRYYHVQIGSFEEMRILAKKKEKWGIPVSITLNSLYYSKEQYKEICEIIERCMAIGFDTFIIADPALILYLRERQTPCKIHISGEMSEINSLMLQNFLPYDIKRIIFHRKNSFEDMQSCIASVQNKFAKNPLAVSKESGISRTVTEFEAFLMNEMCHFTGGYCNSLHCDELCHICQVPYVLGRREDNRKDLLSACEELPIQIPDDDYIPGATGCGLCALWELREAGITHLKLVGRGNYAEYMQRDVAAVKQALGILETSATAEEYKKEMMKAIFNGKCSGNCYYSN